MSKLIRIAPGTVTALDLLADAASVVIDWTRQTDMSARDHWQVSQPQFGVKAEMVPSLEKGTGALYGGYSGVLDFFTLTEDMQNYIRDTIMGTSPIGLVTAYLYDDYNRQFNVFQGELISPHLANAETEYTPFGFDRFTNNQYLFRRGTLVTVSYLLLETGDSLLTEGADKLVLEQQ